jgi:hypothetical protein
MAPEKRFSLLPGARVIMPADTFPMPASEQQRHGERTNQEPENREGFYAYSIVHPSRSKRVVSARTVRYLAHVPLY